MHPVRSLFLAGAACAMALFGAAAYAQAYVNATVGGELAPGVYGRINIGNAPPPPLLYAQPVIIQRPPMVTHRPPIYMYVPPGHAKHWRKHCAHYNACAQPVYFVKEPRRPQHFGPRMHGEDRHWNGHEHRGRHGGRAHHGHD